MNRIPHNCTNCKHEHVDYLTCMPTWWCDSPNCKGSREVGYSPMSRCRIFEPKELLVTDGECQNCGAKVVSDAR